MNKWIYIFNRKAYNSRTSLVPIRDPGKSGRRISKNACILHLPYLLPCDSYCRGYLKAEVYQNKPFTSNAWKENSISYHNSSSCSTSESTPEYDEVLKSVVLSIEAITSSCLKLIKNTDSGVLVLVQSTWVIIVIRESLSQEDWIDKWQRSGKSDEISHIRRVAEAMKATFTLYDILLSSRVGMMGEGRKENWYAGNLARISSCSRFCTINGSIIVILTPQSSYLPLFHSFSKNISGAYYTPGTVLGVRNIALNKNPCPPGTYILVGVSTVWLMDKFWPITCFGK